PILFRCSIAEAEYLRLARREASSKPGQKQANVELILADGTIFPHKGRLDAIERAVDTTTGTLMGQFSFPNPEQLLRPGLYGKARFVTDIKDDALLVPQLAVQEIQGLYSVMVVKPDATVEQRMVKAGERVGNLRIINSGVKPGEKVIVEGLQKVQPGVKVVAKVVKMEQEGAADRPTPTPETKTKTKKAQRKSATANFFTRTPIVAIAISIIIVLMGLFTLKSLSIEQYPFLAPPLIRVTATYPGASAVAVEQSVATPIEQEVNGVDRMIYMESSITSDGRMALDVNFEGGDDQDP